MTQTHQPALDMIAEIMDHIYMGKFDPNMTQIRIGIWDDAAVPYTYYATVTEDGMPIAGECSYGASTLDEAILDLYEDFHQYIATMEAAQ